MLCKSGWKHNKHNVTTLHIQHSALFVTETRFANSISSFKAKIHCRVLDLCCTNLKVFFFCFVCCFFSGRIYLTYVTSVAISALPQLPLSFYVRSCHCTHAGKININLKKTYIATISLLISVIKSPLYAEYNKHMS